MKTPDMIDLLFDLRGETLPAAYPFALWEALLAHVPQLAENEHVGVLPLKAAENDDHVLLPKRVKLAIRLPPHMVAAASVLEGKQLDVAGSILSLGAAKARALQAYPTLHAKLAQGAEDETDFLQVVQAHFAALEISAKTICGKRNTLNDGRQTISGFSLVVHDLKPEASLRLQCAGMGEVKRFGCGIFMPYKSISDLE